MNITVTRELTTAQCGDIAITAAEGGIGYWAVIDSYNPSRWSDDDCFEVPEDFIFYTVHETNELGDALPTPIDVTSRLIAHGIEQVFKYGIRRDLLEQLAVDFDEVDSDVADCIIQMGAFHEIVYG